MDHQEQAPTLMAQESRRFNLVVESLAGGGNGVGRHKGQAVFVPLTAPGDEAHVEITKDHGDWAAAEMSSLIYPSPVRRRPSCHVFGDCGGCQWQHVAYNAQLSAKKRILLDAMRRIGGFDGAAAEDIVPSPGEFGYRHRVQLKIMTARDSLHWGFYARTSHRLVDVRRCLIAHPAINAVMGRLDELLGRLEIDPGRLGNLDINVAGDGRRLECILHPRRRRFPLPCHGRRLSWDADSGPLDISIVNATLARSMPAVAGDFTFPSHGVCLSSGAGVFSQNNLSLNPRLAAKVVAFADPGPLDVAADIYCGVGNYAIPLAALAGRVIGVENNRRACRYGLENARAARLDNVTFIAKPAEEALSEIPFRAKALIINPPRAGAAEIMSGVASLAPERVIYVSCNPPTLARDLRLLAERGYELRRLAPFDMFPQTHHLETVALMIKAQNP